MRSVKASLSPNYPTFSRTPYVKILVAKKVFVVEKKGKRIDNEITLEVEATMPSSTRWRPSFS